MNWKNYLMKKKGRKKIKKKKIKKRKIMIMMKKFKNISNLKNGKK